MNSKKYMIISVITLVIAIIGSSVTYAWYMWSTSEDEETKIVTSLGSAKIFYDSGSNIEGVKLQPTKTKEEGIVVLCQIVGVTKNLDKEI